MGKASHRKINRATRSEEPASFPGPSPETIRRALWLAGIICLTIFAYSNSFHGPFLFDNEQAILKDTRVQAVTGDHIRRIFTHAYWELTPTGLYRPVTTLSYLFNFAVLGNGANPAGYHWFNLLLHAVNIGLAYAVGMAVLEQAPAALALSALWGLHPVLTESVTNIVGRADLFAAFGVLVALLGFREALRSSGRRRVAWLAAIAAAVTIGIFSKESAIVSLAVVALYDLTFVRGVSWRNRLPAYLAAAIPCAVFLAVRAWVIANGPAVNVPFTDNPLLGAGFWTARMTAVKVIGRYFGLLLWPARLSFDYSYNEIPMFGWRLNNSEDWKAILALAACLGAAALAIVSWRWRKPLFFFIAFFFATLAPTSNLIILIGSIMGERFLYLPSLGFVACVVYAADMIRKRAPERLAGAAVAAILIAFCIRIYTRNLDWQDPQRFWQSAVAAAPGSYKARMGAPSNLLMVTQADWDRSVGDVGYALAILDKLPDLENMGDPYCYAGIFYRSLGDRQKSKFWYQEALKALLRSEKILVEQDEIYRQENARRGKPNLTRMPSLLYLELGRTYSRLSEPKLALEAFERGRSLEPDPEVLEELAAAYHGAGKPREAARALVEAMAIDPARTRLIPQLLAYYKAADPGGCAAIRQPGPPALDPSCPVVHDDVCAASREVSANFLRRGQTSEAADIRRVAIQELGCAPGLLN